jgi:hypothetical protein
MVGGPAWIGSFLLREMSQKIILKKRALARGMAPPAKLPPKQAIGLLVTVTLTRPVTMLLFEPIIGWMSLYIAFVFGILFAFFDAFPYIFANVYHFTLGQIGLTYLEIIVGILSAAVAFAIVDKTLYAKAKARVTEPGRSLSQKNDCTCA